jgi:hypothetical protein
MSAERNRAALSMALVAGHEALYAESPTFRAAVDTLADTLPIWVDGMAAQAVKVDQRRAYAERLVKEGVMTSETVGRLLSQSPPQLR